MKLKSHSGLKKRVKKTGTGKLRMKKGCLNHLLINKSKRQKRTSRMGIFVHASSDTAVRRLLPY